MCRHCHDTHQQSTSTAGLGERLGGPLHPPHAQARHRQPQVTQGPGARRGSSTPRPNQLVRAQRAPAACGVWRGGPRATQACVARSLLALCQPGASVIHLQRQQQQQVCIMAAAARKAILISLWGTVRAETGISALRGRRQRPIGSEEPITRTAATLNTSHAWNTCCMTHAGMGHTTSGPCAA